MFDPSKMNELFSQFQDKANEFQKENEQTEISAASGGGLVKVILNGNGEMIDLNIDDSLLEDKESLQILLISAVNDALKSAEENKKNMTMKMLGGLGTSFNFGQN